MTYVSDQVFGSRGESEHAHLRKVVPGPAANEQTSADAGGVSGDERPVRSLWPDGASLSVVVGGLSGAVMAVAAYMVLGELVPAQDLRVPAIAERIVATDQRLDGHERMLRANEVDLARLLDASAALSRRIDEQAARTDQAVAEAGAVRTELRATQGSQSPVFGVAIAQLGLALNSGRPFDAEWVNVHAMTANDPDLREMLLPLMAVSTTGIETAAQLRMRLADLAVERGVPNTATAGLVQYGMMSAQSYFGVWLGYAPADLMASELLHLADQRLARGDVAGATSAITQMPQPYANRLAPWMEVAHRYEAARETAVRLATVSRERLQDRVRTATAN